MYEKVTVRTEYEVCQQQQKKKKKKEEEKEKGKTHAEER